MGWLSILGINLKRFHKSAIALGLSVNDRGTIEGHWGDIRLAAFHTREHYRGETTSDPGYPVTQYWAVLDPPLRMGLSVASRSFMSRLGDAIRGHDDLRVGHPDFDERFWVMALDEEHLRAVLGSGELPAFILSRSALHDRLEIDDRYVTVTEKGHDVGESDIRKAFDTVGRIAVALRHARWAHRARWEHDLVAAWQATAKELGLRLDADRSLMTGELAGVQVEAQVRVEEGLVTRAKARLPEPLGLSLQVVREDRYMSSRLWAGQDIEVGDPFFDEKFVVKGEPEDKVRELLSGEPVERLKDLFQRAADVKIEGDAVLVWTEGALTSSHAIEHMLRATAECAASLLLRSETNTPFR